MLYGDGIHDDTEAIQRLLDSRARLVELPMPAERYMISKPLVIHARQELRLPPLAVIRLMDNSNTMMLKNEAFDLGGAAIDADIAVTGGIWDFNNRGQLPHPWFFPHDEAPDYDGMCVFFRGVKNLRLSGITMKDPITFAITLDTVSYFTVEDIVFDFNHGHPWAINMDGVHLNGNCHYGTIRNLKGACYDDLVALNADEGTDGPITHIDIDGIYAEDCHSAVRLLTRKNALENVHIHNVFGTYYQYCIGVTKFYEGDAPGWYGAVTIDNVYAAKAERIPIYRKDGTYVYPLIYIEGGLRVKSLTISHLRRVEERVAVCTIYVGADTRVERMRLEDITQENRLGERFALMENDGVVESLSASGLCAGGAPLIVDRGAILSLNG